VLPNLKILFLCTGNSCRSQMAEGWARKLHGDLLEPYSAGTRPGRVDPRAVSVMREAGVDISARSRGRSLVRRGGARALPACPRRNPNVYRGLAATARFLTTERRRIEA
jgi:hypothetical protein